MNISQDTDWMLIVEDQIDLWVIMKAQLNRVMPQTQLVHVVNATTALGCLQGCLVEGRPLPQMVLSNLYMPRLDDGLGLLTSLKEPSSSFRHLPVLVISSSTNVQDRQEVNRRGGTYLSKPVGPDQWSDFLKNIQHHWQTSKPGNGDALRNT